MILSCQYFYVKKVNPTQDTFVLDFECQCNEQMVEHTIFNIHILKMAIIFYHN